MNQERLKSVQDGKSGCVRRFVSQTNNATACKGVFDIKQESGIFQADSPPQNLENALTTEASLVGNEVEQFLAVSVVSGSGVDPNQFKIWKQLQNAKMVFQFFFCATISSTLMELIGFFLGDFLPPLKGGKGAFVPFLTGVFAINPVITIDTVAARAKIMAVYREFLLGNKNCERQMIFTNRHLKN